METLNVIFTTYNERKLNIKGTEKREVKKSILKSSTI
jgi:hypothetical protein